MCHTFQSRFGNYGIDRDLHFCTAPKGDLSDVGEWGRVGVESTAAASESEALNGVVKNHRLYKQYREPN